MQSTTTAQLLIEQSITAITTETASMFLENITIVIPYIAGFLVFGVLLRLVRKGFTISSSNVVDMSEIGSDGSYLHSVPYKGYRKDKSQEWNYKHTAN